MKKVISKKAIIALSFASVSAFANANSQAYTKEMTNINTIQTKLNQCLASKSNDTKGDCYNTAIDNYEQIVKNIRQKYKANVPQKVWQSINLGYANQIKNCRNENFYTGKIKQDGLSLYPFLTCQATNMRSFAVTTVELHMKGIA